MGATFAPKTMAAFLVLGVVNLLVPAAFGADPVSVLSILKASKDAIESYDVQRNMEIVHKHYFTTTKEDSAWYYAMEVTKQTFGQELSLEDLQFTERIIQKMNGHLQSCTKLTKIVKADCFSRIGFILLDLEHGLRWPFETGVGQDSNRAKWGVLYNVAALQAAHVAIVAISAMVDGYKDKMYLMKTKATPFTEVLHKHKVYAESDMGPWRSSIARWRMEQVGPAKLCDMKEHLWKSFEQFCETRWHSSEWVLEGPNDEFKGVKRSSVGSNSSIIAHENEESASMRRSDVESGGNSTVNSEVDIGNFDTLTGVEPDDPTLLTKFGGVDNYKVRRYRVQIFDNVPRKVVFEAFAEADPSSRGITLDKLAIRALKARSKVVKDNDKELGKVTGYIDAGTQCDLVFNWINRQF